MFSRLPHVGIAVGGVNFLELVATATFGAILGFAAGNFFVKAVVG
jgi:hypothetical protein